MSTEVIKQDDWEMITTIPLQDNAAKGEVRFEANDPTDRVYACISEIRITPEISNASELSNIFTHNAADKLYFDFGNPTEMRSCTVQFIINHDTETRSRGNGSQIVSCTVKFLANLDGQTVSGSNAMNIETD